MTQLIIICCYLMLLIGLGILANRFLRRTAQDYMLASHTIGPVLLMLSLFGTTMTAFALVGSTGESFTKGIGVYGLMASSSGIVHSLCFFLIGVQLWRLGRRYGYRTQVQFFRDRLQSDLVGLLLFFVVVALIVPYLLIGVMGIGGVIQIMTAGAFPGVGPFAHDNPDLDGGVPPWMASLAICIVVFTYVYFGGMRGTAWANAFQTLVFMILGVVTFVTIAYRLGGQPNFLDNISAIMQRVPEDKLTRAPVAQAEFLTYMLIPLSIAMFPHIFQHWLTARRAATFKLPIVMHPIFILIVWLPCVMVGVWATTLELPEVVENNPNRILPFLVSAKTDALLGGLLAAGILAAIMSSLDSQFLCVGTIFTNDIVNHYIGRDRLSERQMLWLARMFVALVVLVTYVLSLLADRSVFAMAIWCFTGYTGLFPLVFAAIYWRRLTAAGAVAAIVTMAVSWWYFFQQSGFGADSHYLVSLTLGPYTWHVLPVAIVVTATTIAMVVTSLITRPPSEEHLARFYFKPRK